jgi:hypothetical protein
VHTYVEWLKIAEAKIAEAECALDNIAENKGPGDRVGRGRWPAPPARWRYSTSRTQLSQVVQG